MQLHELGLPVRIPAEGAVRSVLSRGQHYNLRARQGKRITVSLAQVVIIKRGRAPMRMTEEAVADLLVVSALARSGEIWDEPGAVGRSSEELDAQEDSAHLYLSESAARVLARLLAVRAGMRRELGMS